MRSWFGFLQATDNIEWDEATCESFVSYRTWRLFTAENEGRVTPATFKKAVPALKMFYDWAVGKGYIEESPIPKAKFQGSPGAIPKNAREQRHKWVTPRTYAMWRNVGLLDRVAIFDMDTGEVRGDIDQVRGARGRNQTRNVAFTDLMITTALRNRELSHLLVPEVPSIAGEESLLPSTISKGSRERSWIVLSPEVLASVDYYIRTVRRAQIRTARARGKYRDSHWILTSSEGAPSGSVRMPSGALRSLDTFSVEERPRLLIDSSEGPEPLMLWLNETGEPMDADSWGNVFMKANNRVSREYVRLGVRSPSPRISAHSLRFTCALFTLLSFAQVIDERLGLDSTSPWIEANYAEAFDFVREFLGHADEGTTKGIYLKPVRDLRRLNGLGGERSLPSLMEFLAKESHLVHNPMVEK
jgi:integrase